MKNLSNERLAEYANDKRMCNINDEIVSMASELLALREAAEHPVAWTDAEELRDVEKNGWGNLFTANPITPHADPRRVIKLYTTPPAPVVPDGYALVPIEPTESMVIDGFESEPDSFFSAPDEWAAYEAMSGCQQAAHKARLCWAAMLAAAPQQEVES